MAAAVMAARIEYGSCKTFCKRSASLTSVSTIGCYAPRQGKYSISAALNCANHLAKAAQVLSSNNISLKELSRRMPSAEELAALQLPALRCSFPPLLNPHYEQVKQECDEWIVAVAQPPSTAACRLLHDCMLPRLVCRFLPHAPLGRPLLHATKMIAWLMIADDDDDHPQLLGSDFSATAHRAARVMAILHDAAPQSADALTARAVLNDHMDGPISRKRCTAPVRLAALAELWEDMSQLMSPSLRSRFTSSMADYFEGLKMQAALRNERCVSDVDSYMCIRRQASFTIPAFILLEYAMSIELDKATIADENIVELRKSAVDYISLCNDIYSFYKEINVGDYFNLPSILYACDSRFKTLTIKGTSSFQNAVDIAAKITLDLDARCDSLMAAIKAEYSNPTIPLSRAYNAHAYVGAVALGMAGALTWFHETPRYQQPCTRTKLH